MEEVVGCYYEVLLCDELVKLCIGCLFDDVELCECVLVVGCVLCVDVY